MQSKVCVGTDRQYSVDISNIFISFFKIRAK